LNEGLKIDALMNLITLQENDSLRNGSISKVPLSEFHSTFHNPHNWGPLEIVTD
jgi:hypothetical protein